MTKAGRNALYLQVKGVHEIIGLVTGIGEVAHISDDESQQLTDAVLDVMAQYKIKPNPKVVAWANLVGVAGVIYAPKMWIVYQMAQMNKPQQSNVQPNAPVDNVFKMNF